MKRINPELDTRYLALHRDQSVDATWDRAHNYYGYGLQEATQDGMNEYVEYVRGDETEKSKLILASITTDQKELARIAFMRSERSTDHATGQGFKGRPRTTNHNFNDDTNWERYKTRNEGNIGGFDHVTDLSDVEVHEVNTSPIDAALSDYTNWLEESGKIDTTANRNSFFMPKGTSEDVVEDQEEFTGVIDPNKKIKIRVMTINGPGIIEVYPDELDTDYNDSNVDDRFLNGNHELLAKIDGMRSSAARRLATDRTYQGYSADDEPADWHDGFIIR